uniref:hypothetical protein n=1 Tax=Streptomyces sp. NRRL S-340 TaxID=1463901 RepID=UPI00131AE73B
SCRWPLPTDSLILPLGAAVSEVASLAIWLDRESEDEEDLADERDAAIALAAGEYPPRATESGDEEEEDEAGRDEEWERYVRVESASHLVLAPPGRSGLLGPHRRQRRLRPPP